MSDALKDQELQQLATEAYLSDPIPAVRCMTDKAIRKLEELLRERHAALTHPVQNAEGGLAVAYVSPEQLAALTDPNDSKSGRYLPARKTQAGKFTQAIYTAPPASQAPKGGDTLLRQFMAEADRAGITHLAITTASQEQADAATSAGTQSGVTLPSELERAFPTSRRIAAVQKLIDLGWTWDGSAWQRLAGGELSPTSGMNLGQRIKHVGGRENAQGYIEFGSVEAVRALVHQVLRDLPTDDDDGDVTGLAGPLPETGWDGGIKSTVPQQQADRKGEAA